MLQVSDLGCVRGERALFSNLSFTLEAGQVLHVRGDNGVGKTSLLRIVVGLTRPVTGELRWNGLPVAHCQEAFRKSLVYQGHRSAVKAELSALENLTVAAAIHGLQVTPAHAGTALVRVGLQGYEDLPMQWLSAGQRRRVLLAQLLLREARLWVLDEPFNALDSNATELLLDMIRTHRERQGLVILTSHQTVNLPDMKELVL